MSPNITEKNNWIKIRLLIALVGISLLILGQWKINIQMPPDSPALPIGIWLTQQIHLGDPNIDQVLYSLPLFVAGGLMLALSLRGIALLPLNEPNIKDTPIELTYLRSKWQWVVVGLMIYLFFLLRLGSPESSALEVPIWLISLTLIAIAVILWDQHRKIDLSPHVSRLDLLWLIVLLAASVVIGAYRLQGFPDQLIGDEGNFWTTARDIAINKFQPSFFAPGVYSFPVFSSIIQGWFLKIFGVSLWGWRFGSVLMGLITVVPLYLLVRELYNRKVAIITSIVLITSPYFIDFSRLGYNNIQALFFTTLTLYWLYLGLIKRSSFYLYLAGCMAGLCFYSYFAARSALVISLLFIILIWWAKKIKSPAVLQSLAFLSLGTVLVVTPYIIYGHNFDPQGLSYKSFESAFFNSFNGLQFYSREELFSVAPPIEISGNELFYNPKIYAVLIARGFIRTMLAFQKAGLISEHYIAYPLSGTIGALFYLIGLVLTLYTAKQPRSLLVLLWFFVNVIGLSTLNTVPPRQTHMVAIIPVLALLTAIGINAITGAASGLQAKLREYGFELLVVLTALIVIGGLYDFFIRAPEQYHAQPGEVISWATLESRNESVIYLYADPSQKDFVPYAEVFRGNVPYEAVPVEEVIRGNKIFSSQPTLVFYTPGVAIDVKAALQKQWGDRYVSNTFYSSDGNMVLLAGMNTPFVFEKDKDVLKVLKDSYILLSLDILLLILLGLLTLVVLLPASLIFKVPQPLKRFVDWFNSPGEPKLEILTDSSDEIILTHPKSEEISAPPPDWVNGNNKTYQTEEPKSSSSRIKAIKTNDGTDFYLHFHVPRITLPGFLAFSPSRKETERTGFIFPLQNFPHPLLLISGVILAITAQILIFSQLIIFGLLAYILSATVLIIWARLNPLWRNVFSHQLNLTSSVESLSIGLLLIITIFTRFFDLNRRVYGLEADETKWTVQSWYSTILRVDLGEFAGMHYKYLPVDFWVRSLFLRIFGLNFISARIESAVLSLFSVLFLYLLVRLLTNSSSVALLSAILFGLSFVELNASHQALHNTPPEPWMLSSLFFLFLALRDKKLWQFQSSGILLGLGMLTYETFYPTPVVALVYLIGLALYEINRKKESVRNWLTRLVLVSWPVILMYFSYSRQYLAGRHGYLFGWLDYYSGNGQGLLGALSFIIFNARDLLITTFSHVVFTDSLINWNGPFLNPFILPFVLIGVIYNLWNFRRPGYLFILLLYIFHAILGSVILGSVWPRVMYLTLPPLMIWAALGLWTTFGALRSLFNDQALKIVVPVFILMVLAIILNDYHIFSSQLVDPLERQKRRELADLTYSSASSTPMILFPFIPNQNDSVEVESHVLLYSVAGARHLGLNAANNYKQLTQESLLPTLWKLKGTDGVDIFSDKTAGSFQDERHAFIQNVLNCYPNALQKSSGRFFDIYHLSSQDLDFPRCYSPVKPTAIMPEENASYGAGQPVIFKWDTNHVPTKSFSLTLERKLDNIFWIEAEDYQGPGWYQETNFISDYIGEGFLIDKENAGQANYDFSVPRSGQYKVWVRFYKRRVNDQHNFIGISGHNLEFADNNSTLNEWVWQDMGTFDLKAGNLPLAFTRTYGKDEQYSVFIDTVVISSDLNYQPNGEDSEWQIIKDTSEVNSNATDYHLSQDLLSGEYRWKVKVFDNDQIVDSMGGRGVESDVIDFVVR